MWVKVAVSTGPAELCAESQPTDASFIDALLEQSGAPGTDPPDQGSMFSAMFHSLQQSLDDHDAGQVLQG